MRSHPITTLAAVSALTLAACGDDATDATPATPATAAPAAPASTDATPTTAPPTPDTKNVGVDVLGIAMGREDLSTFVAALDAAGSMDGLHGTGPFTVFAPTDAAFMDYLGEMGMSPEQLGNDAAALRTLLDNHVVAGNDPSEMVMQMAGQSFTSLAGNPLEVTVDGEAVMVNGATVTEYDLAGSNGVLHVVDAVIGLPPG